MFFVLEWIIENGSYFDEKKVLEIGSGVGLCGLLVGITNPSVQSVILSDYKGYLVDNLMHNIQV